MLFNSPKFIYLFLPITFFVYFYLNHKRLGKIAKVFLVLSSLFFYSWWNITYLPIILFSMIFNYLIGNQLNKDKQKRIRLSKKCILIMGIIANISLLAYFKYTDFLLENFNSIFNTQIALLKLTLPLAISFFTFQQIAYLVDSYKGETKAYDFLHYALFVTFFPQLIAGPIVHHKEMMPQFSQTKNQRIQYKHIATGLFIFSIGLFKKIVIADTFAIWANAGFDTNATLNLFEAWATSLSYTFQLYFDFSAYTDMAIGLALLFNIKLPINFNSPYQATSVQDFWKRWHITLSRFLKEYVYIPLGGNRKNRFRTYSNLMATFIIGGIWHGAGWTFIFWGFLHGLALIIQRIWEKIGFKLWTWFAWFITFNFINIAWIFFRAEEWHRAIEILQSMFGVHGIYFTKKHQDILSFLSNYNFIYFGEITEHIGDGSKVLNWILLAFILIFLRNSTSYLKQKMNIWLMLFALILAIYAINISLVSSSQVFLYYNF